MMNSQQHVQNLSDKTKDLKVYDIPIYYSL